MEINEYIDALKKSVGSEKKTKKDYKLLALKIGVYSFAITFFVHANILYGIKFADNVRDKSDLSLSKKEYVDKINENIYYENDVKVFNNYRNAEIIRNKLNSKSIIEEKDILIELYKMYRSLLKVSKDEAEANMDDVIINLKLMYYGNELFIKIPNNFNGLLANYGYTNKDGVDLNKYKKEMDKLLVKDNNIERLELEINEKIRKRDQD